MATFRKTSLTVLVWLTAVMTLVAGLPHFHCRCPNGQTKPVCLDLAPQTSSCCCGGACCASSEDGQGCCHKHRGSPGGQPLQASCCGEHQEEGTVPQPGSCHAEGTGCVKTPAPLDERALTHAKITAAEELTPGVMLSGQATFIPFSLTAGHGPRSWPAPAPAPPVDLITVLQHFLI